MKKRKLNNKLVFRKETITSLNDMQNIKGGGDDDQTLSLWSCNTANKPCDTCYAWRTLFNKECRTDPN